MEYPRQLGQFYFPQLLMRHRPLLFLMRQLVIPKDLEVFLLEVFLEALVDLNEFGLAAPSRDHVDLVDDLLLGQELGGGAGCLEVMGTHLCGVKS